MQETHPFIVVRQYLAAAPDRDDPSGYEHRLQVEFANGQTKTYAVVDLDRFERLRNYILKEQAYLNAPNFDESVDALYQYGNADEALQPGDLDPLP
jgi:hypothetical protein